MTAASDSPLQDAKARAASMMKAYVLISYRVFANHSLDVGLRLRLADSLLFSRLFFGTETWLSEDAPAIRTLHAARMRVLRRIAGCSRHQPLENTTDEQVLQTLGCNSTAAIVKQRMLVALSSALVRGPMALRALLAAHGHKTKYSLRLTSNLRWLRDRAPCLVGWPDPAEDPAPWLDIIRNCPGEWAKVVKAAVDQCVHCHIAKPKFTVFEPAQPEGQSFVCDLCPPGRARMCDTAKGLKQHKLVVHGLRCPIRPFVVTKVCPVCAHDFGTRMRALRHARNDSKSCRAAILAGSCPLPPPEQLEAADLEERLHVREARKAGIPPGKAVTPGPKPGRKRPLV